MSGQTQLQPTRDLSDVAATLLVSATDEERPDAVAPTGAEDAEVVAQDGQDETVAEDQQQTATEDENGEDEGADPSTQVIELAEDTVLSVTVDGQEVEVTLADLKKAYSGEGAIEKRLQAATEAKKEADAAKAAVQAELQAGREKLVKAFKTFDALMFQPRTEKPDPSMQKTNPTGYLLAMEAWRNEQAQLESRRSEVHSAMQAYEAQQAQQLEQQRREHAMQLVQKVPELARPDTQEGRDKASLITEAMQHYGFSAAEAAQAYDHRLYLMAMDAASYRRMAKATETAKEAPPAAKVKVLRPGGSARVNQLRAGTSADRAALERARQTGRPEDVAATLITKKR